MPYSANILADSIAPYGARLTTFEVTFPRPYLSEFNTHRMFSRNSASSRAIPTELQIEMVRNDPYIPEFRERVRGMGGGRALTGAEKTRSTGTWWEASRLAIAQAEELLNVAKDDANRLLEPFAWQTVIVSSTDWRNFFTLRDDEAAALPIQKVARMMRALYEESEPQLLDYGEWHLPLVSRSEQEDYDNRLLLAGASAGRCARVSYNKHNIEDRIVSSAERWDRLAGNSHWSPSEHPARVCTEEEWDAILRIQDEILNMPEWVQSAFCIGGGIRSLEYIGNFRGFVQLRKLYLGEDGES